MAGWHCYDFRTTASTHLYESRLWAAEVIEIELTRVDCNKARAAYNHAHYVVERKNMMCYWARKLLGERIA
jgi:hypothetical protein